MYIGYYGAISFAQLVTPVGGAYYIRTSVNILCIQVTYYQGSSDQFDSIKPLFKTYLTRSFKDAELIFDRVASLLVHQHHHTSGYYKKAPSKCTTAFQAQLQAQ